MSGSRSLGPRSYLFVPANRPDRVAKACASAADAVIVDLEDAVLAGEKDAARVSLLEALPQLPRPVLVRINGVATTWHEDDLAVATLPNVAGLILPKAESAAQIQVLAQRCPGLPLLALIESARGISQVEEIAASPAVCRLIFGSLDFAADLGLAVEDHALLAFRSRLVLASRLAGLPAPVDGVTTAIDNVERLAREAAYARTLGFGGKLCIHPGQLEAVNAAFVPDAAAIEWARRVVAAGEGASKLDGAMIDKAVVEQAHALLAAAKQYGLAS